jgi:GNAT superfamily N-acetyltransferase
MNMVRPIQLSDFDEVVNIFKTAVAKMIREHIFQWDEIYPNEAIIRKDICDRTMYGRVREDDGQGRKIISVFVLNHEAPPEYARAKFKYDNYIILHRLCINTAEQGKGLGTQAVLDAEKIAKKMGYTAMRLDTFTENPNAIKIYKKLNYEKLAEVTARKGLFYVYEKIL